jgi:hypothetical protein
MYKGTNSLQLFLLLFCLVIPAYSQKSWEKKSYTQWSLSDVEQVLNDSPWSQIQVEDHGSASSPDPNAFHVTIRLRSALPIRQALVRQRQIFVKYDKLSVAEQARFDSEVKEFLDCTDCDKYYFVTLGSSLGTGPQRGAFSDPIWNLRNLSVDDLKPYVYLVNDKGERSPLVHFIPPKVEGSEAMFVFSRFDGQGKPLLTIANKSFYFKIDESVLGRQLVPIKKFTFEIPKLIRNGNILF